VGLNKYGNNGYSSKLRIPGIYEANDESDESLGSYQVKNTPGKNRKKPQINHHEQDSDESVNEEGDVKVKHVDI